MPGAPAHKITHAPRPVNLHASVVLFLRDRRLAR